MRIAVIGDSILWGQGLSPHEKIAARVAEALRLPGLPPPEVHSFAHSGADVWDDGEEDIDAINPIPKPLRELGGVPEVTLRSAPEREQSPCPAEREALGEAPREVPHTLNQVDRAARELADAPPDLILLDAGINDVNVSNIVVPIKSRSAVAERTKSMGDRIRWLLEHVHATFPSSRIVVTGYYRIVTEHSNVGALICYTARLLEQWPGWHQYFNLSAYAPTFFAAAAVLENNRDLLELDVGPASLLPAEPKRVAAAGPRAKLRDLLVEPLRSRLVDLSQVFADTAHEVLGEQVEAFNARHGHCAWLAIPSIPPEHAIMTREPWLFGLDDKLAPQDELVSIRRELCDRFDVAAHTRFAWERASMGHPNAYGAQAYAEAILAQIG